MPSLEDNLEKIKSMLDEMGIGTYVIGVKDPDTNDEACMFDGSPSWCIGMLELIKQEVIFGKDNDDEGQP